MRKRTTYKFLTLAAMLTIVTVGCQMFTDTVSKTERANMFMSDLRGENYNDLDDHILPGHQSRNQVADSSYWTGASFGEELHPFEYEVTGTDGDNVHVEVTGSSAEHNGTWIFQMAEDEPDVWYVNGLYHQNHPNDPYIPEG